MGFAQAGLARRGCSAAPGKDTLRLSEPQFLYMYSELVALPPSPLGLQGMVTSPRGPWAEFCLWPLRSLVGRSSPLTYRREQRWRGDATGDPRRRWLELGRPSNGPIRFIRCFKVDNEARLCPVHLLRAASPPTLASRGALPAQPRPAEVIGNFSVRGLFLCPHLFICSIIYLYQTHRYLFYTLSYNQMLINFVLLDFSCLWPSGALSVGPLSHGHAPSLWEFIRHSFTPRTFPALQARSVLYTYFQS